MPASYRVTDRLAPRRAADPLIGDYADQLRAELETATPRGDTGELAGSWVVTPGQYPGVRIISNATPYAAFVEYGTINMPAEPFLGPIIAAHRAAGAL